MRNIPFILAWVLVMTVAHGGILEHNQPEHFLQGFLDGWATFDEDGSLCLGTGSTGLSRVQPPILPGNPQDHGENREVIQTWDSSYMVVPGPNTSTVSILARQGAQWHPAGEIKGVVLTDLCWASGFLFAVLRPERSSPASNHIYRLNTSPGGQLDSPQLTALAPPGWVLKKLAVAGQRLFVMARQVGGNQSRLFELRQLQSSSPGWYDWGMCGEHAHATERLLVWGGRLFWGSLEQAGGLAASLPVPGQDFHMQRFDGTLQQALQSSRNPWPASSGKQALLAHRFVLPAPAQLDRLVIDSNSFGSGQFLYRVAATNQSFFGPWQDSYGQSEIVLEQQGKVIEYLVWQPGQGAYSKLRSVRLEWAYDAPPTSQQWQASAGNSDQGSGNQTRQTAPSGRMVALGEKQQHPGDPQHGRALTHALQTPGSEADPANSLPQTTSTKPSDSSDLTPSEGFPQTAAAQPGQQRSPLSPENRNSPGSHGEAERPGPNDSRAPLPQPAHGSPEGAKAFPIAMASLDSNPSPPMQAASNNAPDNASANNSGNNSGSSAPSSPAAVAGADAADNQPQQANHPTQSPLSPQQQPQNRTDNQPSIRSPEVATAQSNNDGGSEESEPHDAAEESSSTSSPRSMPSLAGAQTNPQQSGDPATNSGSSSASTGNPHQAGNPAVNSSGLGKSGGLANSSGQTSQGASPPAGGSGSAAQPSGGFADGLFADAGLSASPAASGGGADSEGGGTSSAGEGTTAGSYAMVGANSAAVADDHSAGRPKRGLAMLAKPAAGELGASRLYSPPHSGVAGNPTEADQSPQGDPLSLALPNPSDRLANQGSTTPRSSLLSNREKPSNPLLARLQLNPPDTVPGRQADSARHGWWPVVLILLLCLAALAAAPQLAKVKLSASREAQRLPLVRAMHPAAWEKRQRQQCAEENQLAANSLAPAAHALSSGESERLALPAQPRRGDEKPPAVTWQVAEPLPCAIDCALTVVRDGHVFVVSSDGMICMSRVRADGSLCPWAVRLGQLPSDIRGQTLATVGDNLVAVLHNRLFVGRLTEDGLQNPRFVALSANLPSKPMLLELPAGLLVAGGMRERTAVASVFLIPRELLDQPSVSVQSLSPLPRPVGQGRLFAERGQIFCFESGLAARKSPLYVFQSSTNPTTGVSAWQTASRLPGNSRYQSVACWNKQFWFFDARSGNESTVVYSSRLAKNEDGLSSWVRHSETIPAAVAHPSIAYVAGRFLMIGGRSLKSGASHQTMVHWWSPQTC